MSWKTSKALLNYGISSSCMKLVQCDKSSKIPPNIWFVPWGMWKIPLIENMHTNLYPSAPNVRYFHLCNFSSKYVNSKLKHTLKYMNVSQHVKEVNHYPSLPLLAIWAFCHKISPLLWKEDINKIFYVSKWSTLHLCSSPLRHVIQMKIFLFFNMVFFFYTCDPWLCHKILQIILKVWELLFMDEASGMRQVI